MVSDSLGPGALGQRLVKDMCEYLGCVGGLALREYGRAIRLAFRALEIPRGSRIAVSPLAPRVYMEVLREQGFEAVYADVEEDSGCISPAGVQAVRGEGLAAIVAHATLGFVPDMEGFLELGVPLIEDVSQAVGANTGTRKLGCFGAYTIVSLEPDGIITAGGGALLLGRGRKETQALLRLPQQPLAGELLPDFNAALGITQIKNIEKFIGKRKEIAAIFSRAAMRSRHRMLSQKGDAENIFFSFPLLLASGMKDVQAYARKKGIESEAAFGESVLAYVAEDDAAAKMYPVARSFLLRCLLFPLYPSLTTEPVKQIEQVLSTLP
jgi:dTDP-4-amino-4,6-dideoxygalactose transaminase